MHIQQAPIIGNNQKGMKVYGMVIQIAQGPGFPLSFAFTWSWGVSTGPSDSRGMPLTPALCCLLKKKKKENEDRILIDALCREMGIDKEVLTM